MKAIRKYALRALGYLAGFSIMSFIGSLDSMDFSTLIRCAAINLIGLAYIVLYAYVIDCYNYNKEVE